METETQTGHAWLCLRSGKNEVSVLNGDPSCPQTYIHVLISEPVVVTLLGKRVFVDAVTDFRMSLSRWVLNPKYNNKYPRRNKRKETEEEKAM